MADIDLSSFDIDQLADLVGKAHSEMASREKQRRTDLRSELERRIKAEGYKIPDIFPASRMRERLLHVFLRTFSRPRAGGAQGRAFPESGAALRGSGDALPRAMPVSVVVRPYRVVCTGGPPPRGSPRGPRPVLRNGHGQGRISSQRAVPLRSTPAVVVASKRSSGCDCCSACPRVTGPRYRAIRGAAVR